ncbi:acyltransferase [Sphingosinicellaceae bacterium]|nr:acyltransferase [Sphingosinicellaceae bacterium]
MLRSRPIAPAIDHVLPQLTSLRYFAALLVMVSHLDFLKQSTAAPLRRIYDGFLHEGYCGVSFFFVLSGLILSHAYRDALLSRRITVTAYLARRAARILPMHWLVALPFIAWLALAEGRPIEPLLVTLNLLLLHAWAVPGTLHFSLNGPSWSLSVEMFFYAMFPLLILLPRAVLARIATLQFTGIAAMALAAAILVPGFSPDIEWLFYVNPLVRLLEFITGMLVYDAWRQGHLRAWAGTRFELVLVALVPACMAGFVALDVPLPLRWQLAYLPLAAALVFVFACGDGMISRGLRSRVLVGLGEASFSLYLIHRPIFTLVARLSQPLSPAAEIATAGGLLAGCSLLSIVVHRHVEAPVTARLNRALASHAVARGLRQGISR